MTSPATPTPDPEQFCDNCHHRRKAHIPRCTDPMLGSGKWCDCEAFTEEVKTDGESAESTSAGKGPVRRPPVRTREG